MRIGKWVGTGDGARFWSRVSRGARVPTISHMALNERLMRLIGGQEKRWDYVGEEEHEANQGFNRRINIPRRP